MVLARPSSALGATSEAPESLSRAAVLWATVCICTLGRKREPHQGWYGKTKNAMMKKEKKMEVVKDERKRKGM